MAMTIVEAPPGITGGVDTHLDKHVEPAWVSWRLQTLERLESWNKSTPHRSGTRLS